MPTNTYVALSTYTIPSAVASYTFTSIPQGYTDLVIVGNLGTTSGSANIALQVGNTTIDTGSNYSFTNVNGDGSSAASSRASNQAQIYIDYSAYPTTTLTSTYIWQVQNYSNTTTNKTVLGRSNTASRGTNATVGLWRSTAAINTIKLDTQSTTFLSGSTFSLYGIAASSVGAKATGGIISSDDQYYYHTFPASGTFTPLQSLTADYLVVAGGGGGGSLDGGGGGAGGLRSTVTATGGGGSLETALSLIATNYTVTIGAGGSGGSGATGNVNGSNGSDSVFSTITSTGGGFGGSNNAGFGSVSSVGAPGGSGGGTGPRNVAAGAGTANQGYAGGLSTGTRDSGGGGGGANAVGAAGVNAVGGAGGAGVTTIISGSSTTYAGGGGAGSLNTGSGGAGGSGGGGTGTNTNTVGGTGTANTGGGGGGSGFNGSATANGGAGGSGIVIVRYAK